LWYFVIFLLELSWQCCIMLFFYWNCPDSVIFCCFSIGTILTVWYFVFFLLNIIPHCQDSSNRKITKYHTVRTVPTSMKNNKIPHCRASSNIYEKHQNTTLSGQFQHLWKTTKYHTVRTVPIEKKQNTTLSG
jgi:hypothetical protein